MKAFIIGLFCLALGIDDGLCQGKVLVVTRDTHCFIQQYSYSSVTNNLANLKSALEKHYQGEVVIHFGLLPDSLAQYDAIFTDLRFSDDDDSATIKNEIEKLSHFLLSKGRLYIELSLYTLHQSKFDSGFYALAGVNDIAGASMSITGISQVNGVGGSFTHGLHYTRSTNPTEENALSILMLNGDLLTVLTADGLSYDPILAWQHEKENRKVVWHWPIVQEHYEEFLGRVICNYFGLCEPLGVEEREQSEGAFSVAYDPTSNRLILQNVDEFSTLEMYNLLGVKLFERKISERVIELPHGLLSGNYFVVVRGTNKVIAKPVIVWR